MTPNLTNESQTLPATSSGFVYALVNTKDDLASVIRNQVDFLRDKIYKPLAATWAGRIVAAPASAVSFLIQTVLVLHFIVLFSAVIFCAHLGGEKMPVDVEESEESLSDQAFEDYISQHVEEEEPVQEAAPPAHNLANASRLLDELTAGDNGLENPFEGLPKSTRTQIPQADLFHGLLGAVETRENPKPVSKKIEIVLKESIEFDPLTPSKRNEEVLSFPDKGKVKNLQDKGKRLADERAQPNNRLQKLHEEEMNALKENVEQAEKRALEERFEYQQKLLKDAALEHEKAKATSISSDSADIQAKVAQVEQLKAQCAQQGLQPHEMRFVKKEILRIEAEIVRDRALQRQHSQDKGQVMKVLVDNQLVSRIVLPKSEQS